MKNYKDTFAFIKKLDSHIDFQQMKEAGMLWQEFTTEWHYQYGDYVIQTVSKILQDNVRAVDVVARYGGEEFAVILINTTAVMSNMVAKRIVDNIADYEFSMDGVDTRVTISGGMSEYPTHSENMKELIEMADQAMYATKQKVGNGIIIHNEDEKTGEQVNPA